LGQYIYCVKNNAGQQQHYQPPQKPTVQVPHLANPIAVTTFEPGNGPMQADLADATTLDGAILFNAACATCHGMALQGTSQGPTLIGVGAAAVDIVGCCVAAPLDGSHKLLCQLLDGASWRCAATLKLHGLPAAAKLLRRLAPHWECELQGVRAVRRTERGGARLVAAVCLPQVHRAAVVGWRRAGVQAAAAAAVRLLVLRALLLLLLLLLRGRRVVGVAKGGRGTKLI
jgi:hypothetical protein